MALRWRSTNFDELRLIYDLERRLFVRDNLLGITHTAFSSLVRLIEMFFRRRRGNISVLHQHEKTLHDVRLRCQTTLSDIPNLGA